MQAPLDSATLAALAGRFPAPEIIDVRTAAAVEANPVVVPGALMRDPATLLDWAARLERWREVVVYCKAGHERSLDGASTLCALGYRARPLAGGLAAWQAAGQRTIPLRPPTRWVTRERPKIDRIACPWLVRRFVDPAADSIYVPPADVRAFAVAHDATPFDVPDVEYTHDGAACSFDAFIARLELRDAGARPARGHRARRRHRRGSSSRPQCAGPARAIARTVAAASPTTTRCSRAGCWCTTRCTHGAAHAGRDAPWNRRRCGAA